MLVYKRRLYFVVSVGFLLGFEVVKCETNDYKESEKGNCNDQWRKHDTHCFLPVQSRLNLFGALTHCARMKSLVDAGNFSKALVPAVCEHITSLNRTGKLYGNNCFERGAYWAWLNGSVFREWDRWQIVFTDVACNGCGFWKNGTIHLTSNCSQRISYVCEKDRGSSNSLSLNQRPLKSWEEANNSCRGLLQLSKHDDNLTHALMNNSPPKSSTQRNVSYWLGLRKDVKCQKEKFKQRLFNVSQIEMKKCRYVKNFIPDFCDCDEDNHAICVKSVPSPKCPHNWSFTTTKSCWRAFKKVTMTWVATYHFCSTQGGHLASLSEVQAINDTSISIDGRQYWINLPVDDYFSSDLLRGWYWLNRSSFNAQQQWGLGGIVRHTAGKGKCALIRNQKDGVLWHDSFCDLPPLFICQKTKSYNFSFIDKGRIEESLNEKIDEFLKILRGNLLIWNKEYFYCSGVSQKVLVRNTTLERLHKWREYLSSIPNVTIRKKCERKPDCVVTAVEVMLKNVTINPSGNSSDISDIIILEYIANDQRIIKLEKDETISLKFCNKRGLDTKVRCCFLNESRLWSEKGMKNGLLGNETVECVTDHLSAFTVVLDPKMTSKPHTFALELINYIGSGLSLAGLLFSCAVYAALYKDLLILTTARHLVHLNLQIALGLTQITFLFGRIATDYEVACKVIAIMVHYFSLAGFLWMLLEAVMLYLKLIAVYGGEFLRIRNFLLCGWGVPLLLVGLSAGVKLDAYGTYQWCWLSDKDGFTWVFFAPVIVVILISLAVIIAVVRVLFLASKSEGSDAKKNIICAARGVVILFPTLGLSWGFSVLAVNHDVLVWKYLFAFFTSLQGFLIFVIYGVCNTEIRVAVSRKLGFNIHPVTSST